MRMRCPLRHAGRRFTVLTSRPFLPRLLLAVTLAGLLCQWPAGGAAVQAAVAEHSGTDLTQDAISDAIDWQPCPENAALECGTLLLPVDYRQPHGETFAMAVVRARALHARTRLGVLFTHPGIHLSGVDFLLRGVESPVLARLRARFDIVSLDPRGVGRSRPLDCGLGLPAVPGELSDDALIAYFDDYGQRLAARCLAQDRDFVLSISANTFARDIEMLRRALGEHRLSFGMISNSGAVAAVYASLFPRQVRAMLIDSPVAPEFRDYLLERWSEVAASYDLALRRIEQLCQQDVRCPLRETGVVAAFDTVLARLRRAPVPTPGGTVFTARMLSDAFASLLPVEALWPRLPDALAQALAGDVTFFLQFPSPLSQTDDGTRARNCNDYGTRRAAADALPVLDALGATYPRFFGRLVLGSFIASCSAWPAADPPVIRHVQRQLAVPALLIGSAFDPNAPLAWTKRLAQALGMERHIVRYQGGGHGLAWRSDIPCLSEVIDNYLFELRLPPADYSCPAVALGP